MIDIECFKKSLKTDYKSIFKLSEVIIAIIIGLFLGYLFMDYATGFNCMVLLEGIILVGGVVWILLKGRDFLYGTPAIVFMVTSDLILVVLPSFYFVMLNASQKVGDATTPLPDFVIPLFIVGILLNLILIPVTYAYVRCKK